MRIACLLPEVRQTAAVPEPPSEHAKRHRPGTWVTIHHEETGTLLAEGRKGWDMLPFEGNWYIRKRCLHSGRWRTTGWPGLCFYKGLYLWVTLEAAGVQDRLVAWRYVVANPLFFFIWGRIGVADGDPRLVVERTPAPARAG